MTTWTLIFYVVTGGLNGGITSQTIQGYTSPDACNFAAAIIEKHTYTTAYCVPVK